LYSVTQAGQLISINPTTGAVANIGPLNGVTGGVFFGGLFGAPNGLFGALNNGGFYQIDIATGAVTLLSGAPGSTSNDGANCAAAPIAFGADLQVTKTNTPAQGPDDLADDSYTPGANVTYTIVVSNPGPFGAQNVTVSDPLPAGVSTASWTCVGAGGGVCAASGTGAINDVTVDLPVGATVTYTLTMTVPDPYNATGGVSGPLTNTVTVSPGPATTDPTPGNNTAADTDTATARLTIRKVSMGGVDSFGFTGTNGVVAQTLTTTTPGTPVAGATQILTATGTATTVTESTSPVTYQVSDITCTGLGAGGTATPDLANRTVVLDAAATAAGANIECTFTNTLQQTDIQVVKTASPDPVLSEGVVTYSIVVTNNGPLAASDVVLTDTAGAGQDCTTPSTTATCSASGGASCPGATVLVADLTGAGITIPTLPVGGQVTVQMQCTVTASGS
jgi:uncharacterized repeat protein (TIGR01451 family)